MQKLEITIEKHPTLPSVQIAHFNGAFDGSVKEPLVDIEKLINESTEKLDLIFDLKDLSYLNSYAIGQLVAWHNHLMKNQGQIIVAGANKEVEEIFNVLGISNLFKIFPSVEEAVQSLSA
jgi:anti-anti-sigma factor